GWNQTGNDGRQDKRAAARTKKDAQDLIRTLMDQIGKGADFDALMKQYSEDPGSATTARAYSVSPDAQLVIEFKQLGLRLKIGEVGALQSEYGFHIMKRVKELRPAPAAAATTAGRIVAGRVEAVRAQPLACDPLRQVRSLLTGRLRASLVER